MDVVNILVNNNCGIRICTTDELIKIWLHELGISYSLNKFIFKSDERYHRFKHKCCFCKNKADIYLYNGYHSHICSVKHSYLKRVTTNFCDSCFTKAILFVEQNRIFVYQVIKTNVLLCDDVNNIIINNFINVTRYYQQLLGGFIDV